MSTWKSVLDDAQRKWVRDWWRALQPRDPNSDPLPPMFTGLDRGARAQLRRGVDADDLLLESSVHLLADRLIALDVHRKAFSLRDDSATRVRLALVSGVLVHVRADEQDGCSLALRLGRAAGDDQPLMSELRFKRLLKARDEVDLLRQWRRAVKLADGKADVAQLGVDLLAWQIEQAQPDARASDGVRFRWARDYYLTRREQIAAEEPASIKELNA